MIARLPGIGGTLFPGQYVADRLLRDAAPINERDRLRLARALPQWWAQVESRCGPSTGLRTLFDLAAMPLFGLLGFRADRASFDRHSVSARLRTPGGTPLALLILPWAAARPAAWRAGVAASRAVDAAWCFLFAPPFLSLMPSCGAAVQRTIDFVFPDACGPMSIDRLLALVRPDRFDPAGGEPPLDALLRSAAAFQGRVRADLQRGVLHALDALAPSVAAEARRGDEPAFAQTLTIVYRILFLLFAESRDLLPRDHAVYREAYAMATICRQAASSPHARGLWEALAAVTRLSRAGCRVDDLSVTGFNGRLFAHAAAPALEAGRPAARRTARSDDRDAAMQRALVALATRSTPAGREEISYADLGVEQLGTVYERVLDLEPTSLGAPRLAPARTARRVHSLRRKRTGTFYTPQDLTDFVVRRALRPLVAGRSADGILALRVVDPAMGSGAFLVAACRYLAAAYAQALIEEGRCHAGDLGPAECGGLRRLIAERCLAGVDANPIAVQLARLSLWLASLAEGKPLSFLDHRLRIGDTLVGAWPEDLRRVSDRRASLAPLPLFDDLDLEHSLRDVVEPIGALLRRPDDTIADVRAKEAAWSALAGGGSPLARWRQAASLWCARWFWPSDRAPLHGAPLRAALDALLHRDRTLRADHLSRLLQTAATLQDRHRFFHWPLEFPDVFFDARGARLDRPGFDAVVGNPPWEMLRGDGTPRDAAGRALVRFVRECGAYRSCGSGHMNLYQPFLERALRLARPGGRLGLVLPWGLASDDGAAALRRRVFESASVDALVGFDNAAGIFPIHRGLRFMVLTATAGSPTREFRAYFGVTTKDEIAALPDGGEPGPIDGRPPIRISRELVERVGGAGRRIPDVRRPGELDLLERAVHRFPRLGAKEGWHARFGRELNATEDRPSFGRSGLPVLEGKHVQPFAVAIETRQRISRDEAERRLPARPFVLPRLAYRDVAGVTNRLSLIAGVVPAGVVTTHTLFCLRTRLPIARQHFLCGLFNSYVVNAFVRMLMGTHLTTSLIEDLPVPPWEDTPWTRALAAIALRLARSSAHSTGSRQRERASAFARSAPQRDVAETDGGRHARLQALVAHLYGLDGREFAGVLSGFPLVPAPTRDAALAAFGAIARS